MASAEAIAKRKEDRAKRMNDKPWLTEKSKGQKKGKKQLEPRSKPEEKPTANPLKTSVGEKAKIARKGQPQVNVSARPASSQANKSAPFSPIKPNSRPKSGPSGSKLGRVSVQKEDNLQSPRSTSSIGIGHSVRSDRTATRPPSTSKPSCSRKRPRRQQSHRSMQANASCNPSLNGSRIDDDVFEAQIVETIVDDAFSEAFRNWGWSPHKNHSKVSFSKVGLSLRQVKKKTIKQRPVPPKRHHNHNHADNFEVTLPEHMEPGSAEAENYQLHVAQVRDMLYCYA
jgi:hypothetical protein